MDEKAKLDAILLTSMKPGDSSGMGGHAPTRFGVPNIPGSNWPPRMPMINPANRPLHPNYRCVICKKPGHHKNLCPEAVRQFFFIIEPFFFCVRLNFYIRWFLIHEDLKIKSSIYFTPKHKNKERNVFHKKEEIYN